MSDITATTRRELVLAIRGRYQASSFVEKQRILDEFVALTGYHRKHAIRILRSSNLGAALSRRARREEFRSLDEPQVGARWRKRVRDLTVCVA